MGEHEYQTLLQFFKALANENRLKILGMLANRECGVEELAILLDIKAPTVSHHLSLLRELGLLDMRMDGNDHLYRLNIDNLQNMNKEMFSSLTSDQVATLVDEEVYEAWERKVLNTFLEGDQITAIPTGYKKRLVVLKWLVNFFKEGIRYAEKDINTILEQHHFDYCYFRRAFIENGLMVRENGVYWRIAWQMPDLS